MNTKKILKLVGFFALITVMAVNYLNINNPENSFSVIEIKDVQASSPNCSSGADDVCIEEDSNGYYVIYNAEEI